MGLLDQQSYAGYANEGQRLAVEPMSFTPMDAAKFVAEATPIIGDAMAAKEIYDELQKPKPNYGLVAVLGGASLLGLIPLIGDAASPALKKVGKGLLNMADRIEVDPNALGMSGGNIRLSKPDMINDLSKLKTKVKELKRIHIKNPNNKDAYNNYMDAYLEKNSLQDKISATDKSKVIKGGGLTVYHGSPHDFDKFDISKMGTGEGAQAYGDGLYFADEEKLARNYRDQLSKDLTAKIGDKDLSAYYSEFSNYADSLPAGRASEVAYEKLGFLEQLELTSNFDDALKMIESKDVRDWAEGTVKPNFKPQGNMYEVKIRANEEDFLDWDAPIDEQSQNVQKGLLEILTGGDQILKELYRDNPAGLLGDFKSTSGYDAYNDIVSRNTDKSNQTIFTNSYQDYNSPEAAAGRKLASKILDEQGIKGIRYLDAGSRGMGFEVKLDHKGVPYETEPLLARSRKEAEELAKSYNKKGFGTNIKQQGSKNTVVFNDDILDIARKFGFVGGSGLLGYNVLNNDEQTLKNNMGLL